MVVLLNPRSGLVGVATGQDEIKFSSKAGGSVRSISFMHTERLVPVDEPPDDDANDEGPQPPQEKSSMSFTTGDAQSGSDNNLTKDPAGDDNIEVYNVNCREMRLI